MHGYVILLFQLNTLNNSKWSNSSIWPLDVSLKGIPTPGQSEHVSIDNVGVLHIRKSSRTKTSLSYDLCHIQDTGWWGYFSTEMMSAYFTAPADWSLCLSVCLSVCLSLSLSIYLSLYIYIEFTHASESARPNFSWAILKQKNLKLWTLEICHFKFYFVYTIIRRLTIVRTIRKRINVKKKNLGSFY